MNGRDAVGDQVTALGDAPVSADVVHLLGILGFGKLGTQTYGNVDREGLRQQGYLARCRKGLDARDYRHVDSGLAAAALEFIEEAVVEEHLGYDVVCAGIDLLLQHFNVRFDIRSLEVFLRIGSHAYAHSRLASADGFDQLAGIAVAPGCGGKALFSGKTVTPEGQDVVYAHIPETLYLALDPVCRGSGADDMRDDIDVVAFHYGRRHCHFADALAYGLFPVSPVRVRDEFHLVAVTGHIDVLGVEFHQGTDAVEQFLAAYAPERRYYFE